MKRNNILKAVALILLASVLIVSCEGWSAADNIITQSASVTENYYTVTIYVDSLSFSVKATTIPEESELDAYTSYVTKTGYDLAGWYCDETGALFDDWGESLTSDLTVHAAWGLTSSNMNDAFTSGGYYALTSDVAVSGYGSSYTKTVSSDLTVDLNGYTLDVTTGNTSSDCNFISVTSAAVVTFANGELNINCVDADGTTKYSIATYTTLSLNTGTLNLDSVTLNITGATGIYPQKASDVNITDSTVAVVDGCYALATNNAESGTEAGVYTIENSVIYCVGPVEYGYSGTGVLINRSASSSGNSDNTLLYIKNSEIYGARSALVVRGGTAEVSNSTLATIDEYEYFQNSTSTYKTRDTAWASGSEVILATVALGCNTNNQSSTAGDSISIPYTANTDVTFSNVTFGENSRWVIGVGTVSNSSTSPTVTIAIDEDQENLITVTRMDTSGTVTVNGDSSWTVNTSYRTVSNSKYAVE